MSSLLQWGILGTGSIADRFAGALAHSSTGKLVAVASRSADKAKQFAQKHGGIQPFSSYEAMLADSAIQAVYIATPHPSHARWAIHAAECGKHILCEKPLAMNHPEAMAIVEAARENGVFLMEAFMYRCHPLIHKLVELVREKVLGEVQWIDTAFSFRCGGDPASRLMNPELGGGGILDVGCYTASMARLLAGAALGRPFAEPELVSGAGVIGTTGVDEWAVANLKFPGSILATMVCGVRMATPGHVTVYATEGKIRVENPWIILREGGSAGIELIPLKGEPRIENVSTSQWLYSIEADVVANNLKKGEAPSPAMGLEDSLGNMKLLDRWRECIGLVYRSETPEGFSVPVHGKALAHRSKDVMKYGRIADLDQPISRLVMGVDNQPTYAHAAVMFDDFFERGGTAFDTAYVYQGGKAEGKLGDWMKCRGVRKDVFVIGKGAHTPLCLPEFLSVQLYETLERMSTDYLDLYMMHRDNPEVPASEFIDVMNEHHGKGLIRAFGVSNWSIERINEANDYAIRNGKRGIVALSHNFSLARMVSPVWKGCVSLSGKEERGWLQKTGLPLFAWSSQARGFFTERAHPDKQEDGELVRCWYADDNFERKRRAELLAARKGVQPINIALAYVLCQPTPMFALIGPRLLEETRTSLPGLELALSPEEMEWLNLEREQL